MAVSYAAHPHVIGAAVYKLSVYYLHVEKKIRTFIGTDIPATLY